MRRPIRMENHQSRGRAFNRRLNFGCAGIPRQYCPTSQPESIVDVFTPMVIRQCDHSVRGLQNLAQLGVRGRVKIGQQHVRMAASHDFEEVVERRG